jgi:TolA-binding protein
MKQTYFRIAFVFLTICLQTADSRAQLSSVLEPSEVSADSVQPYNLKLLIKKSHENIQSLNDKIRNQDIIRRNHKREEKSKEYYHKAQDLSAKGRTDEARVYYEKAINILEHPEMKESVEATAVWTKAPVKEANQIYDEAAVLYEQKKFKEAKAAFSSVEEIKPDFKAVRSYLHLIELETARIDEGDDGGSLAA